MRQTLISLLFSVIGFSSCQSGFDSNGKKSSEAIDTIAEKKAITSMLDSFNRAAARADYSAYFDFYTEDATFLGTDATEHWDKQAFMLWSKPIFDRGRAWDFTSLERHIFFGKCSEIAWFDELLSTQMMLCRGSGVLVKVDDNWKVQQYVLSATIPNKVMDRVVSIKLPLDSVLINSLKGIE